MAPPPGRAEELPAKPDGADTWIDGEWIHRHGRWYWLLGRWVKAPPGATYRPWVVVRASDGTPFYAASQWVDEKGNPVDPPQPLAYATASGVGVVSPGGDLEETGRIIKTVPSHSHPRNAEGAPQDASSAAAASASSAPSMPPPPTPSAPAPATSSTPAPEAPK